MKKWEHEAISEAANATHFDCHGQLYEWNELAEALTANGVPLHPGVRMKAVKEICRLILAESKIGSVYKNSQAVKAFREALLDREVYASDNDIAEAYGDYCESFACRRWVSDLSHWEGVKHIGPVDYIAARVSK